MFGKRVQSTESVTGTKLWNRAKPQPPLSNEIFGLIIESLGKDVPSLRSCSLVSSIFRHFCSPLLYRDIELDCEEKLESFIQLGEHSGSASLVHVKSLSLTYSGFETPEHLRQPHRILEIISFKTSLETLRLHHVQFQEEPFTAQLLSRLCTVIVLVLEECCFEGFEDFVSFIRCFPRCQVLRLHSCTWARDPQNLKFRGLPAYDLSLTRLVITRSPGQFRGRRFFDQGTIVGMPWLDLSGLKSFAYVISGTTVSAPVVSHVATCETLEDLDIGVALFVKHEFGK